MEAIRSTVRESHNQRHGGTPLAALLSGPRAIFQQIASPNIVSNDGASPPRYRPPALAYFEECSPLVDLGKGRIATAQGLS